MIGIHEIIVGNVGTVFVDTDGQDAKKVFEQYVRESCSGIGRSYGEDVTWMIDDEIVEEHFGFIAEGIRQWPVVDMWRNVYHQRPARTALKMENLMRNW